MHIFNIKERLNIADTAAEWFHSKWGIPLEEYRKSIQESLLGSSAVPQWYIAMDGSKLVGGAGIIENDFHSRKDLAPNVCALYVEEEYRRRGIARALLLRVQDDMRAAGFKSLYLITGHDSFYERCGWEFLCMVKADGEPDMMRMYVYRL